MTGNKGFVAAVVGLSFVCFALLAFVATPKRQSSGPARPEIASAELLIRAHSPTKGPESAPVTIVEFLDPECESCRLLHPVVRRLQTEYGDRLRVVIRYMPFHGGSALAAASLEEARELGKYDQALDVLFENQPTWGSHHDPRPELIASYLAAMGVAPESLVPERVIAKHGWKIEQDRADGAALGVRGTPVFFVNGVRLQSLGYEPLKQAIEAVLASR